MSVILNLDEYKMMKEAENVIHSDEIPMDESTVSGLDIQEEMKWALSQPSPIRLASYVRGTTPIEVGQIYNIDGVLSIVESIVAFGGVSNKVAKDPRAQASFQVLVSELDEDGNVIGTNTINHLAKVFPIFEGGKIRMSPDETSGLKVMNDLVKYLQSNGFPKAKGSKSVSSNSYSDTERFNISVAPKGKLADVLAVLKEAGLGTTKDSTGLQDKFDSESYSIGKVKFEVFQEKKNKGEIRIQIIGKKKAKKGSYSQYD